MVVHVQIKADNFVTRVTYTVGDYERFGETDTH